MKITLKDIKSTIPENRTYYARYCEIQDIENKGRRIGYNAGVYGWNYDLYEFIVNTEYADLKRIYIITGYRPVHYGKRLTPETLKTIKDNVVTVY